MKKILKIENISLVISIIMGILVFVMNLITNGVGPNGVDLLFILCLLLVYPIRNLYSSKLIKIKSIFYHSILTLVNLYIIYVSVYCVYLWIVLWLKEEFNLYALLFFEHLIPMYILIFICYLISLFCKKDIIYREKYNNRILYLIIFLISLIYLLPSNTIWDNIFIISTASIYLIMYKMEYRAYKKIELQVVYIVTAVFALITYKFLTLILIYQLFINLYKFKNEYIE